MVVRQASFAIIVRQGKGDGMKKYLFVCLVLLLAGCGGGEETAGGNKNREHVWSGQVKTIDKAKNVEDVLGEASARQRQEIDEQSQ